LPGEVELRGSGRPGKFDKTETHQRHLPKKGGKPRGI